MKELFAGFSETFRKICQSRKTEADETTDKKVIEEEHIKKAVARNRSLLLLVSIWAGLFQLFNIYRVLFLSKAKLTTLNNRIYFGFYLSLLVISVVYIYIEKRLKLSNEKLYWVHMAGGTAFLLWQTIFNAYDIIRSESPGNLTLSVTLMAFSAMFMMKPAFFAANLAGLSAMFLLMAGKTLSFGVEYNYIIMLLLCVVVYYQRYNYEKTELDQQQKIATAKKAYLEEHERFRLTHEQYDIVCRSSQLITFKWDVKQGTAYFSKQWNTILGQPLYVPNLEEFVKISETLESSDKERILSCAENVKNGVPYQKMELCIPGSDGVQRWYEVRVTTQENSEGEPIYGIGTLLDIMEQKQEIKKIRRRAETDFTGVLNKAAIEKYGRSRIRHLNTDEIFIMLILDLDDFKHINDTLGHLAGDRVLEELAAYMKENAIPGMQVGRIGGDEFAALYVGTGTLGLRLANGYAEKIQKFTQSMQLSGEKGSVRVSIGIAAMGKESGMTFDDLYAEADKALYEAKKAGKGRIMWGGGTPAPVETAK